MALQIVDQHGVGGAWVHNQDEDRDTIQKLCKFFQLVVWEELRIKSLTTTHHLNIHFFPTEVLIMLPEVIKKSQEDGDTAWVKLIREGTKPVNLAFKRVSHNQTGFEIVRFDVIWLRPSISMSCYMTFEELVHESEEKSMQFEGTLENRTRRQSTPHTRITVKFDDIESNESVVKTNQPNWQVIGLVSAYSSNSDGRVLFDFNDLVWDEFIKECVTNRTFAIKHDTVRSAMFMIHYMGRGHQYELEKTSRAKYLICKLKELGNGTDKVYSGKLKEPGGRTDNGYSESDGFVSESDGFVCTQNRYGLFVVFVCSGRNEGAFLIELHVVYRTFEPIGRFSDFKELNAYQIADVTNSSSLDSLMQSMCIRCNLPIREPKLTCQPRSTQTKGGSPGSKPAPASS